MPLPASEQRDRLKRGSRSRGKAALAKQLLLSPDSKAVVPHRREPHSLDDLPLASPFFLVYWPQQCETIKDRIKDRFKHIDWMPTTPEPLYTPTGLEMMPPYQTPDKGTVIYLEEVKLPTTASDKQVGDNFSCECLIHDAKGNHEKPSVPQEMGKRVCHDMILSIRENFHSSSCNLVSWKMKKHNGKGLFKSAEKAFQYLKAHDHSAKTNLKKRRKENDDEAPLKKHKAKENQDKM